MESCIIFPAQAGRSLLIVDGTLVDTLVCTWSRVTEALIFSSIFNLEWRDLLCMLVFFFPILYDFING